jgi:hypothetical protein
MDPADRALVYRLGIALTALNSSPASTSRVATNTI